MKRRALRRRYGRAAASTYEVIVGNIGTVYSGSNHLEATRTWASYVKDSKSGGGRADGESVTLMKNGEIEREHIGHNED
jgi:hypothetical protein